MIASTVTTQQHGMIEKLVEIAAQSGFTAVLLVVILWFGREELRGLGARIIEQGKEIAAALSEVREEIKEARMAQDRNTKMVTIALLQLATLVPGAKAQLEEIDKNIDRANARDSK